MFLLALLALWFSSLRRNDKRALPPPFMWASNRVGCFLKVGKGQNWWRVLIVLKKRNMGFWGEKKMEPRGRQFCGNVVEKGFCSHVTWLKGMKKDVCRVVKVLDWFGPKFPLGTEGRSAPHKAPSGRVQTKSGTMVETQCFLYISPAAAAVTIAVDFSGDCRSHVLATHSSLRDSAVGLVLFLMWGHHHRPHNPVSGSGGFGVNAALDLLGSQSRRKSLMKAVWKHCCFEVKANDGRGARRQN